MRTRRECISDSPSGLHSAICSWTRRSVRRCVASECLHASAHHGATRLLSAPLLGLGRCDCMQVLPTAPSLLSSQVRDLLGLSRAIEGSITVLPKLWCHCDRYWNFLTRCRMQVLTTAPSLLSPQVPLRPLLELPHALPHADAPTHGIAFWMPDGFIVRLDGH